MDLPNRIANAVVTAFDALDKSGKPTVRSNGTKEWSVLAGLVAIHQDSVSVLTLATGVKSMPDSVREYSDGWIVHDNHAEILCLRAFNWLLVDEAVRLSKKVGDKHELILLCEDIDGKRPFRLKNDVSLALYISEPPCGDASMSVVSSNCADSWEPPAKKLKVMRGRAHFNKVGIVRTKPGRADSLVTYSKSCSDKLCLKQFIGILNCVTSQLVLPIYLDYLVLQRAKYNKTDFLRCFNERLQSNPPASQQLKVLLFDSDKYQFHKSDHASPLPLSIVYCVPTKTKEVLNNGVKNGAFVKKKPPKPTGASMLCKRKMYSHAKEMVGNVRKYDELKIDRREDKEHAWKQFDSWPRTSKEDIELG
ncbi:CIC11C00000002534 [Sungouiella intermedia]|uniref:CIC11C00000002534 n=1 Tax=Sungouiella intermedia TaxID=45354 RepID=A0A1L0D9P0_9ASCO|nr:CIC11C00000002534 [[Candida] intermedia]